MASRTQSRFAVGMKDVRADQVSQHTSDQEVRREMISSRKARSGDDGCSAIGESLHPGFGIFVRDRAGHHEFEHWVSGGKRRVDAVILEERAFPCPLKRTLTGSDQLHSGVNGKGIGQRLYG